ncbi:MAG: hypothetical protein AVDCRST_MAG49-2265, partial [uncultured Thermomicrobiales bacterium]
DALRRRARVGDPARAGAPAPRRPDCAPHPQATPRRGPRPRPGGDGGTDRPTARHRRADGRISPLPGGRARPAM